ncbi:MAG TPA: hypothetical protein VGD17_11935 [Chitinophagaceae bacterium]
MKRRARLFIYIDSRVFLDYRTITGGSLEVHWSFTGGSLELPNSPFID